MAKPKTPLPLFPLKHDFVASLDRFIHEAGMLRDAVKTVLTIDVSLPVGVKELLAERIKAFDMARFGEIEARFAGDGD